VVPEQELHEAVAKALAFLVIPPAQWTTFPAGSVPLPPEFATKLYRLGLARGWPDILLIHQGQTFGLELKRPGASLSATRTVRTRRGSLRVLIGQRDVHPLLEAAGMRIAVCHSVDEAIDQCHAWGIPMRGHS
jgi:hypothetical protein